MDVMRGVTFGFYARNGVLGSDWAKDQVHKMLDTGVKWVVLCPTVLQDTAHSTVQYRDFEVTPNDHEVYGIIDYMHQKGLKVHLRPMLETQNGCGRLRIWFRSDDERMPGAPAAFGLTGLKVCACAVFITRVLLRIAVVSCTDSTL